MSGVFVDRVHLGLVAVSALSVLAILPAQAETHEVSPSLTQPASKMQENRDERLDLPYLSDLEQPSTTVTDWIAQIEASLVQITGVRVEKTETGLQMVLETAEGSLQVPGTRAISNAVIADIPNATIAEEFSQADLIAGIALVEVTRLPGNQVRVAITGTDALPVAEVTSDAQGLVLAVTLGDVDAVTEEDTIQILVTGEQDTGYYVPEASTATRTDTPLRDIPQSIQVVPQEVLRDQQAVRLEDALQNVSGVTQITPRSFFPLACLPTIEL